MIVVAVGVTHRVISIVSPHWGVLAEIWSKGYNTCLCRLCENGCGVCSIWSHGLPASSSGCSRKCVLLFCLCCVYCEDFGSRVFDVGVIRGRISTNLGRMSRTDMTLLCLNMCIMWVNFVQWLVAPPGDYWSVLIKKQWHEAVFEREVRICSGELNNNNKIQYLYSAIITRCSLALYSTIINLQIN